MKKRRKGRKKDKRTKNRGMVGKIGKWKAKREDFAVTILGSFSNLMEQYTPLLCTRLEINCLFYFSSSNYPCSGPRVEPGHGDGRGGWDGERGHRCRQDAPHTHRHSQVNFKGYIYLNIRIFPLPVGNSTLFLRRILSNQKVQPFLLCFSIVCRQVHVFSFWKVVGVAAFVWLALF